MFRLETDIYNVPEEVITGSNLYITTWPIYLHSHNTRRGFLETWDSSLFRYYWSKNGPIRAKKKRWKWENASRAAVLWWLSVILGSVARLASVYSVQSRPELIALIVASQQRQGNNKLQPTHNCAGALDKDGNYCQRWQSLSFIDMATRLWNTGFLCPPAFALFLLIFAVFIPWLFPCIALPLPPLIIVHWREFY